MTVVVIDPVTKAQRPNGTISKGEEGTKKYLVQFLVQSAGVANGQAVAVAPPQRGRVCGAVGACDARLLDGGLQKGVGTLMSCR